MTPIRLLLVDDHGMVRAGIRALLSNLAGMTVVGEAGDGHTALIAIAAQRPDVVLLDIGLPGLNGLEVTARVVRDYAPTRVIILSMHANEEYVAQALHNGATGYLLKGSLPGELEIAIRAVAQGETYLSPPVSRQVVLAYLDRVRVDTPASADGLTARQREILQRIAEGYTTAAIAATLHVSSKTVEAHRANLMARLKIYDVPGLVRYALRHGLIDSES